MYVADVPVLTVLFSIDDDNNQTFEKVIIENLFFYLFFCFSCFCILLDSFKVCILVFCKLNVKYEDIFFLLFNYGLHTGISPCMFT